MYSAAQGVRFAPADFKYHGRVAIALVPSLLVAASLGGRPVMGILTIGAMVWYLMDAMQLREAALSVGWGTLGLANFGLLYTLILEGLDRPLLLSLLLALLMGALFAVAGMWLTLQFKWVQLQYPAVILAFERQVITAALPLGAAVQSIGIASLVEASDVPYYLAALLCLLYFQLGRPLVSSFHQAKQERSYGGASAGAPSAAIVQGRLDAAIMWLLTLLLPATMYLAIHASLLHHWLHLWSLVLLLSVPALFLSVLPNGMWWLPASFIVQTGMRRLLMVLAGIGVMAGVEGRVIFHAFTPYIALPAPWNYIAVTAALLGLVALVVAHLAGLLGSIHDLTVAGICLLLCTAAGGLVMGVPLQWMPAPLLAACGLAMFYESRSLREFALFVVGALLTAAWFVWHHFWFLDVRVGSLHLHTMCKLALAAVLPALLVPGLILANMGHQMVGVLLLVQAELLCVMEEQLYAGHTQAAQASMDMMYPSYLVIATSAAGVAVAQAMYRAGHLPRWASWVVSTLYCAKLSMLLLPEAYLVLPTGVLLLAATSPLYLHEPSDRQRRIRIPPWQGLAHFKVTVVALALARFAVFDVVAWAVNGRPSEGVLLGALVVVAAVALGPLVLHCYSHNQATSRLLAALAVSGVLLMLLEPPLPRAGGAACPRLPFALCPRLWDERHVPMHDADDIAIWGYGLGLKEHWPRWLLMAAAGVGMLGVVGAGVGLRSPAVRVLLGGASGALVGQYLALEVVPAQPPLQMLVLISVVVVVAFCVLLQNPLLGSPTWLPGVGLGWMALFGTTMVLQATLPLPVLERYQRLYPDNMAGIQQERADAVRAGLLGVFAAEALLLAFSLKLRISAALHAGDKPGSAPTLAGYSALEDPLVRSLRTSCGGAPDMFCSALPPGVVAQLMSTLQLEGPGGVALRRLGRAGLVWVPVACNVCTLVAFGTCLALNRYLTGGAPEAVFLLAPLLLLLAQDPLLLRHLGEQQRYVPPLAAIAAYLSLTAVREVVGYGSGDAGDLVLNLTALVLALPLHLTFLHHTWTQHRQPLLVLVVLGPLALLAVLVSRYESIQYLGGSGLVLGVVQLFTSRRHRAAGMKAI